MAEATLDSGSLITAKLAAEQGKTVFAIPGHIYSEFHQGCHQLIREGAILVDHPEQVIEDLALPTQWLSQQQATLSATASTATHSTLPEHLLALYSQLDWAGKNMDQLASELQQETAHLTAQLMELELLGMAMQQSGYICVVVHRNKVHNSTPRITSKGVPHDYNLCCRSSHLSTARTGAGLSYRGSLGSRL